VEEFLDESHHQEPSDLFSNGPLPFVVEAAKALFDWFGSG
jgi:hypothetical protein